MTFNATIVIGSTVCNKPIEGKNRDDAVKQYVKHSWSTRHIAEPAFEDGSYHIMLKSDKSRKTQGHLQVK